MCVVPSCSSSSVGKQSQLILKPTKVELGLQVGVEFDNKSFLSDEGGTSHSALNNTLITRIKEGMIKNKTRKGEMWPHAYQFFFAYMFMQRNLSLII